jgi:hypothetical protein
MSIGRASPLGPVLARVGPISPLRALAVLVAAAALAGAASQVAFFGRIGWQMHERPARLVRNADIDALQYFAPTASLAAARQLIPPGATYAIAVGDQPPVADPELIRIVFRFWLLPRAYTERLPDADWVVAFHRSSESLGVPVAQEIGVAPDVNVVRVKR